MSEDKKLNMPQSLLLLLLIIGAVAVCIRLKTGGPMIGLFFSWIIIYLFCKVLKIDYDHVVGGAYDAIPRSRADAVSVNVHWCHDRNLAAERDHRIHYCRRLKADRSNLLLPLTLIFCAVLSLVTGTSYGSSAVPVLP